MQVLAERMQIAATAGGVLCCCSTAKAFSCHLGMHKQRRLFKNLLSVVCSTILKQMHGLKKGKKNVNQKDPTQAKKTAKTSTLGKMITRDGK